MKRESVGRRSAQTEQFETLAGLLMVAGALVYLGATGALTLHTVVATVLGVFFSVLLGCGLFAAAFFSDKSGIDQDVANATRRDRDETQ